MKGIDLQIKPGEFIVIAGPSGRGEVTVLKMIGYMDTPTKIPQGKRGFL